MLTVFQQKMGRYVVFVQRSPTAHSAVWETAFYQAYDLSGDE